MEKYPKNTTNVTVYKNIHEEISKKTEIGTYTDACNTENGVGTAVTTKYRKYNC
jgi:hypothetical protein